MALIGTVGRMLRRAITQVNRILVKRRDSPGFSRELRHHFAALGCVYLVMTRPITLASVEPSETRRNEDPEMSSKEFLNAAFFCRFDASFHEAGAVC